MNDVQLTSEPKPTQRRGWLLFALVNVLLLGGCLWAVGSYNDWSGDDHLRSGEIITSSDRVVFRIIACLILIGLFGMTFSQLHGWISWTRWVTGPLMILGLITGLFGGTSYMFGVSAMLVAAFVAASLGTIYLPTSRRWAFALAMISISYGTFLASHVSLPRHQRLIEARNLFPFEDISSRLDYEPGRNSTVDLPVEFVSDDELADAEQSEGSYAPDMETEKAATRRNGRLASFHDEEFERFIRAEGFGVSRMIYPHKNQGALPPIRDIAFDEKFGPFNPDYKDSIFEHRPQEEERTDKDSPLPFDLFYQRSLDDFLNPITFGFVRSRQLVAGFQPHAFHIPIIPEDQSEDLPTLTKLQLVSLLRFDPPEVYELDHLPRMDQLSTDDIETRALDNFEHFALMRIQNGEEIIVDSSGPTIRMLGAIRARTDCLQCHTVEVGSLLGAFSYKFTNPTPGGTVETR